MAERRMLNVRDFMHDHTWEHADPGRPKSVC